MFRHKLGEFRKDLEFMDLNLDAKVSTVRASEIGPNIRSTFINYPDQGLPTLAPQESHPNCF